jgi:NifU-like protein involved in Fe-S cluster formation
MFPFSKRVQEYFFQPRFVDEWQPAKPIYTIQKHTQDRSTVMQMQLYVVEGHIKDSCFKILGCPCCIAVMSYLCEQLINQPVSVLEAIHGEQIIEYFSLPREKYYCALLGEDVVRALHKQIKECSPQA